MSRYLAADGVGLEYDITGDGPVVILVHGFASDAHVNWVRPGVVRALVDSGRRVVTYDARGHGRSDKPHDPAAYGDHVMVADLLGLADHLGLPGFDVVGYSMGAQVTAWALPDEPRARRAVLGGIGSRLLLPGAPTARYPASAIAEALEADDPDAVASATGRAFRAFADATKADRLALAALQRARVVDRFPNLAAISVPVLVLVGDHDTLIGDATALADALPDGRLAVVRGDHLSAVVDRAFAREVVDFLAVS